MDFTLPGSSLNAQFDLLWERFQRLNSTRDTLNGWRMRWQRWITPINVSFIVPIEDEEICHFLGAAQEVLKPYMAYAPQPPDKLHMTLYQVGYLRTGLPWLGTWTREALAKIQTFASQNLALIEPFDVKIGPINAFPNVPIVEIHDGGKMRLLRAAVSQAAPRLRRPLPTFPLIPHVTLGYFGERPAEPIRKAMEPLRRLRPVTMRVERVDMTLYYREPGPYEPSQALLHSVEQVIASLRVGESGEAKLDRFAQSDS